MATVSPSQAKDDIRRYGDLLGIPQDRVEREIDKQRDDAVMLRALRRKWSDRVRANNARFNRELDARQLDEWTRAARVRDEERALEAARERRQQRERMERPARLAKVLADAAALASVGAAPVSASPKGGERPVLPAGGSQVDLRAHLTVIDAKIEEMERLVDAERGLLPAEDYAQMPGEQKDKLILRLAGVHSQTVSEDFPYLGSARTIERRRIDMAREMGVEVHPSTGLPKQPRQQQEAA